MKRHVVSISMTEEGYRALLEYMREEPVKYRTLSAALADLCSVGLEAVTGRRIALAGESWGGRRTGAGRRPKAGSPAHAARKTRTRIKP